MGNKVISQPRIDYSQSIDKLIDPRSGQAVMGRFEVYPLWCTKVKGDPEYDDNLAQAMLARHRSKRRRCNMALQPVRRKCAAYFLTDRIHFRGYHFDHWLLYRQILEYHRGFPLASVFVLFVIDRESFHRSYQSFECVYPSDSKAIHKFISTILADPQRLVETEAIRKPPLANECLIRPHWTYRDEMDYYARQSAENLDEEMCSWEYIEHDDESVDTHVYERVSTKSNSEPMRRAISVASLPILHNDQSPNLTPEVISHLPVTRKITVS